MIKFLFCFQGTKSPVADAEGEDVFFSAVESTPPVVTESIPVIPEETSQVNGMGIDTSTTQTDDKKSGRGSKPTAKVEPVKKVVVQESHIAEEREKRRSKRREELSDSSKRPSSPTKHHERPKSLHEPSKRPSSPMKEIRRTGSPTKEFKRPSSPTKDVRRPSSPAKDVRRPSSPVKDVRRPSSPMKTASDRTRRTHRPIEESKSPTTKAQQHQRPEIPQVLRQNRTRSNSSESNSSSAASEGKRSPSRHIGHAKDSVDSRGSPAGSPKRQYKEPSARLLELSKPRKTQTPEGNKSSTSKSTEKKTTFGKTTPSPKKQPKMRLSKEAERRLKATQKTETTSISTVTEKPEVKTSSEEESQKVVASLQQGPVVQSEIKASVVAVEEQTPNGIVAQENKVEKTESKPEDEDSGFKTPPTEIVKETSIDIVPVLSPSPTEMVKETSVDIVPVLSPSLEQIPEREQAQSPEPEDIKKDALSKKDSGLLAVMKARAEKIDKEYEEQEKAKQEKLFKVDAESSSSSEDTNDVSMELSPSLSVPVSHRLRAFQIPPGTKPPKSKDSPTETSPKSPTSPKSKDSLPEFPPMSPTAESPAIKSPTGSPKRALIRSPTKSAKGEQLQVLPDR